MSELFQAVLIWWYRQQGLMMVRFTVLWAREGERGWNIHECTELYHHFTGAPVLEHESMRMAHRMLYELGIRDLKSSEYMWRYTVLR
jgi:hypothetical protein